MGDVIKATTASNKTPGKLEWRVLIVDSQSMRMVSACTKMHELSAEGITSTLAPFLSDRVEMLSIFCLQHVSRQYYKQVLYMIIFLSPFNAGLLKSVQIRISSISDFVPIFQLWRPLKRNGSLFQRWRLFISSPRQKIPSVS